MFRKPKQQTLKADQTSKISRQVTQQAHFFVVDLFY